VQGVHRIEVNVSGQPAGAAYAGDDSRVGVIEAELIHCLGQLN
jgi:hypothetical protein